MPTKCVSVCFLRTFLVKLDIIAISAIIVFVQCRFAFVTVFMPLPCHVKSTTPPRRRKKKSLSVCLLLDCSLLCRAHHFVLLLAVCNNFVNGQLLPPRKPIHNTQQIYIAVMHDLITAYATRTLTMSNNGVIHPLQRGAGLHSFIKLYSSRLVLVLIVVIMHIGIELLEDTAEVGSGQDSLAFLPHSQLFFPKFQLST